MRSLFAFFTLLIPFFSVEAMVRSGEVYVEEPDDANYEDDVEEVWIGPGLYYGLWFGDEDEYHHWWRNNHHHWHGHHNGGHGGHRSGGERHHGGHSGGGHGGHGGHGGGHR